MNVEHASAIELRSDAIFQSLREHGSLPTPENYALWFDYHRGANPALIRTIDALISNHATLDEKTLRDLYRRFLSSAKEEQAVREASLRALETLQDLIALADRGRADAKEFGVTLSEFATGDLGKTMETLKVSIEHLVTESGRMANRTEYLGARMQESSEKIQTLERNLESALRDATMDALTGVANRKSFDQTIRTLAGDAMNSDGDLALLMIDVDHFKQVNDTWGHPVGDAVLRHIASILQLAVRGEDSVARYGGEEFSVLLPHTNIASALNVAENIRHSLARSQPRLDLDPALHPLTVSIGASCYEPGEPLAEWVQRGDSALYRAKANGRDRVHTLEGTND